MEAKDLIKLHFHKNNEGTVELQADIIIIIIIII